MPVAGLIAGWTLALLVCLNGANDGNAFAAEHLGGAAGNGAKPPAARPQFGRPVLVENVADEPRGGLVLADRRDLRRLAAARELIENEKFVEGVRLLQRLLDADEDRFYHPEGEKGGRAVSLKREVGRLIDDLPPEGRRSYALQFGATAHAALAEAASAGDWQGIEQVARSWPSTEAGGEALWQLGLYEFDRAEPLAAALCFQRLQRQPNVARRFEPWLSLRAAVCWQRAGLPEKEAAALRLLGEQMRGKERIRIGGRDVRLFATAEAAPQWLAGEFGVAADASDLVSADWPMPGGNCARTASRCVAVTTEETDWPAAGIRTIGDPFQSPVETGATVLDRRIDAVLARLFDDEPEVRGGRLRLKPVVQPQPIVVGGTVCLRTLGNIAAFDLAGGARKWETLPDEVLEQILEPLVANPQAKSPELVGLVRQRLFRDAAFGTLSSDGRLVFGIEDADQCGDSGNQRRLRYSNPLRSRETNRLAAYDLATGKLVWERGGRRGALALELAGTFFLGPPLPLEGTLYCLAEIDREICLLVLNAADGRLKWSQRLSVVDAPVSADSDRRMAGAACAYDEGVLICPTGIGCVVAVELATRTLLWQHRTAAARPDVHVGGFDGRITRRTASGRIVETVVTANRKVLAISTEPAAVCCLDLLDGTRYWEERLSESRCEFVGLAGGRLYLATFDGVEARGLSDGKPAWGDRCEFPEGATLCGRGFLQESRLYLPLSAEVDGTPAGMIAIVDGPTGRLLAAPIVLPGRRLGNLICTGRQIVSQGVGSLDVFAVPEP